MRRYTDIDMFVALLPEGEENAIKRKDLTVSCIKAGLISPTAKDPDRAMRNMLHIARIDHCILSKHEGGYYIPTADEWKLIYKHKEAEHKRALRTMASVSYAGKLYEDYAKERLN